MMGESMKKRTLGNSNLGVSALGLGCMGIAPTKDRLETAMR